MATTTGTVIKLKVSQGGLAATFMLKEADSGDNELFILWWPSTADFDYIYHSAWLAMLRDAIVHSLPVNVGHEEDSAVATTLAINAPPP